PAARLRLRRRAAVARELAWPAGGARRPPRAAGRAEAIAPSLPNRTGVRTPQPPTRAPDRAGAHGLAGRGRARVGLDLHFEGAADPRCLERSRGRARRD